MRGRKIPDFLRRLGEGEITTGQPSNPNETNPGQSLNQGGSLGGGKIITEEDVALYELYTRMPKLLRENGNVTTNQEDIGFRKNRDIYERMPELDRGINQPMTELDRENEIDCDNKENDQGIYGT